MRYKATYHLLRNNTIRDRATNHFIDNDNISDRAIYISLEINILRDGA